MYKFKFEYIQIELTLYKLVKSYVFVLKSIYNVIYLLFITHFTGTSVMF